MSQEEQNKKIEGEVKKLEVMNEVPMSNEEREAFDYISRENEVALRTTKFITDVVKITLTKKERKQKREQMQSLAILKMEMETIRQCDNDFKLRSFQEYVRDKAHTRRWHVYMSAIKYAAIIIIFFMGGVPAVIALAPKILGGMP